MQALNVASDSSKRAMVAHTIILLVEEGGTPNDQLREDRRYGAKELRSSINAQ